MGTRAQLGVLASATVSPARRSLRRMHAAILAEPADLQEGPLGVSLELGQRLSRLLGLRLRQRWDQSVTAEQRRAAGQESKKHKYFPSQRVLGSKEIEHHVSTGVDQRPFKSCSRNLFKFSLRRQRFHNSSTTSACRSSDAQQEPPAFL